MAQYAQACNLFAFDDVERKLDILRRHCADVGRDYDEIEKTVMVPLDPGADGEKVDALLTNLQRLAGLGVSEAHGWVPAVETITPLEVLGREGDPGGRETLRRRALVHTATHPCTCCTVCTARFRCARAVPVCTARPRVPDPLVPGTRHRRLSPSSSGRRSSPG